MAAPTSATTSTGRSRRSPLKALVLSGGLVAVGALGYLAARRARGTTPAVAPEPPRVADVPSAGD